MQKKKKKKKNTPLTLQWEDWQLPEGQISFTHGLSLIRDPIQVSIGELSSTVIHVRRWIFFPWPHVTEHSSKGDQDDHWRDAERNR